MGARDRLAVALDVPRLEDAERLIGALGDSGPGWLKVGAELFTAAGPAAVAAAARRARVFLDTKIHDIPNTAARAVAAATGHGVSMLTLHAGGGRSMLRAAREAADAEAARLGARAPTLLGVTVLTSLSPADLKELGIATAVEDHVARLAELALEAGIDGVVASPHEALALRARFGERFVLVTPGIRPSDWPADDQSRAATAADAVAAGADVLVVGRPVVRAPDPVAAVRGLVQEIERAEGARRA